MEKRSPTTSISACGMVARQAKVRSLLLPCLRRVVAEKVERAHNRPMLTAAHIRAAFHYDPETGILTHKRETRGRRTKGAQVGQPTAASDYGRINIGGATHLPHRLIWLWMTGEWPPCDIDHKDMDPGNNRWSNLRLATKTQNYANCGKRSHNTTGWKGVYRTPHGKPWRAAISVERHQKHLGAFDCPAAAHLAYAVAAARTFGEFARAA